MRIQEAVTNASTQTDRVVDEVRTSSTCRETRRRYGASSRHPSACSPLGRAGEPRQDRRSSRTVTRRGRGTLRGVGDIEWTADGRVEGFGLTRRPTQHRIRISQADLHTWCAMDTLIFAAFLERPVQIESPDGATGETLRLRTDGRRVIAADPPTIVVSWFFDPAGTGFRASVCQFGHFFASRESAPAWAATYPQGGVLTLDEAMEAARGLVSEMFGVDGAAAR